MYLIGRKIINFVNKETGEAVTFVKLWGCVNADPDKNEKGLVIEELRMSLTKFSDCNVDSLIGEKCNVKVNYNKYGKVDSIQKI